MNNNDSRPRERDILMPPSPPPDVSNKRANFGRIATPDRTAGVFEAPTAPAIPGATGTPSTPTVSDTRTVSNAGTGQRIGMQPVLPATKAGDLKYGITPATRGKGEAEGSGK